MVLLGFDWAECCEHGRQLHKMGSCVSCHPPVRKPVPSVLDTPPPVRPPRPGRDVQRDSTKEYGTGGRPRSLTLTPREKEIAIHLATGRSTAKVAASLGITPVTVNSQVQNACHRLGLGGKQELIEYVRAIGAKAVLA